MTSKLLINFLFRKAKNPEEIEMNSRPSKEPEEGGNDDCREKPEAGAGSAVGQGAIGVFVHQSELLKMDFLVSHPVVKVRYFCVSDHN